MMEIKVRMQFSLIIKLGSHWQHYEQVTERLHKQGKKHLNSMSLMSPE